jgi:alpha-D-ribose 1-methylphosphonate 5-triphosphate synthase subunit PhnG
VLSCERHQSFTVGRYELSSNIDNLEMANPTGDSARETDTIARRRATMAALADAPVGDIERGIEAVGSALGALPAHDAIRPAECGLVMVQGRVGGDGAPFNVGEATVSRAAVRLRSGETGFGYVLGRDREKAHLVALCDALVQSERYRDAVEAHVVAPIRTRAEAARRRQAEQAAATKVDFFTLVRGED